MPVNIGDPILAADYNTLAGLINDWFSDGCSSCSFGDSDQKFGWGGSAITSVNAGDPVLAFDFNEMIDRVNIASSVVDATAMINVLVQVFQGQTILASDYNNIETEESKIRLFKNNVYSYETSIHAGTTDQRTTSWTNQISSIVRYTFTDFDEARYFFNSGGKCLLSLELTGGTTGNATSWAATLSNAGTISYDLEDTTQSGSGGIETQLGYYDSTTAFQTIFIMNSLGAYSANQLKIQVRRSASGHWIEFKVILDDQAVGSVDGTTTLTAQYRKLNDQSSGSNSLSITAPSVSVEKTFE